MDKPLRFVDACPRQAVAWVGLIVLVIGFWSGARDLDDPARILLQLLTGIGGAFTALVLILINARVRPLEEKKEEETAEHKASHAA